MTSCRLQSYYSSTVTLHDGPVVLRPVRATPCYNSTGTLKRFVIFVWYFYNITSTWIFFVAYHLAVPTLLATSAFLDEQFISQTRFHHCLNLAIIIFVQPLHLIWFHPASTIAFATYLRRLLQTRHCNSLFYKLPKSQINQLQHIQLLNYFF